MGKAVWKKKRNIKRIFNRVCYYQCISKKMENVVVCDLLEEAEKGQLKNSPQLLKIIFSTLYI